MNNYLQTFWQLTRFGIVGVIAATVHFTVVLIVVETFNTPPLAANILAFLIAFQVSYFGHRRFTFNATDVDHRQAFPRLMLVQLINLVFNEATFYFFLSLNLSYPVALFITLSILPLFTFLSTKFWVFR